MKAFDTSTVFDLEDTKRMSIFQLNNTYKYKI